MEQVVIADLNIRTCNASITQSDKGTFNWPQTMADITVSLPCPKGPQFDFQPSNPSQQATAHRSCSKFGIWNMVDDTNCRFQTELTQQLFLLTRVR